MRFTPLRQTGKGWVTVDGDFNIEAPACSAGKLRARRRKEKRAKRRDTEDAEKKEERLVALPRGQLFLSYCRL
jgi:hypothetical protein